MITGIPKQTRVDALRAKQLGQPIDVYEPKIAEFPKTSPWWMK